MSVFAVCGRFQSVVGGMSVQAADTKPLVVEVWEWEAQGRSPDEALPDVLA